MSIQKTIIAAFMSAAAVSTMPAFADDLETSKTVVFEINQSQSADMIYQDIRQQAWAACRSERGTNTVSSRLHGRKACQRALVEEAIENLELAAVKTYVASLKKAASGVE